MSPIGEGIQRFVKRSKGRPGGGRSGMGIWTCLGEGGKGKSAG